MNVRHDLTETLAGLSLFADLSRPQVEACTHTFEEIWFNEGQRILRLGFSQPAFYVIIDGEAAVRIDGEERARLKKGDFFGEIAVLLGEAPSADVVALTGLRCITIPGDELQHFLQDFPQVMFRVLQTEARRLRSAIQWRT